MRDTINVKIYFQQDRYNALYGKFTPENKASDRDKAYEEMAIVISAIGPPKSVDQVKTRLATMKCNAKARARAVFIDQESDMFYVRSTPS
jgi:hypothetical protein